MPEWDKVWTMSQFCPPESRDKSLENRDKNLDKRESEREREKSAYTPAKHGEGINRYGRYENVILTEKEYHSLVSDYPDEYTEMIEHLSFYMASKGRTYENHLATMEKWKAEDRKRKQADKRGYVYNGSFEEGESL